MFTGLVETTGTLGKRERRGPGFRMEIDTELDSLLLGESISVSGVCLTIVAATGRSFCADISHETAERTTLGRIPIGSEVNLERSLRLGDRLGGHLVSGHVDGLARIASSESVGEARRVGVAVLAEQSRFIAPKGSICLDGVSLTVNQLIPVGFEVMLIPHTLQVTNLKHLRVGQELNLEVDLIARYLVHYLEQAGTAPNVDSNLAGALQRAGIK